MKSILYIEDNQDDVHAAIRLFEGTDMNMTCVSNVNSAFVSMGKKIYDLVVCDMLMPGHDGLSFAKMLSDTDNSIPFVLTSGAPSLRGFDSYHGFKNYLGFVVKPITPEKIQKFISLEESNGNSAR